MHQFDHHNNCHGGCSRPVYHHGLMGIFGGIINLTTSVMHSGARVVRTVVEGSVWHGLCNGCAPYNDRCRCYQPVQHCYCIECAPKTYTSCCR